MHSSELYSIKGLVPAGIYPTSSPESCAYCTKLTDTEILVLDGNDQLSKVFHDPNSQLLCPRPLDIGDCWTQFYKNDYLVFRYHRCSACSEGHCCVGGRNRSNSCSQISNFHRSSFNLSALQLNFVTLTLSQSTLTMPLNINNPFALYPLIDEIVLTYWYNIK